MAINYGSNSITTDNKITSGAIDITDGYNTLYFYSTDGDWSTATNWYLDYDHTIAAGRIPTINDIAVILNELTSVTSGEIIAKEIIVRDSGYLDVGDDVYKSDVKFFNSTYISTGQIAGNAIFYDTSYLETGGASGTPVITGNLTLKNSSYITTSIGVYVGGTVTFDDSSYIGSYSSLYCPNVIINSTSTNAVNYYSNVVVNSNVAVSYMSIYGDLTLNNSSYSNGNNSIYYGKLILKNSSYIASSTGVTFYGESQLILDNFDNTTNVYSAYITDNDNALTIIVNSKIPSYGWMFDGISGTNSISCRTLIFNNVSYYSGLNNLDAKKVVFNDTSYWGSSGSLNGPAAPVKIVFNDESYNDGTAGDSYSLVEFNDSSYNDGTVAGRAIFNDYSENHTSCTVNDQAVFKGWSKNYGSIDGDAWFDEFSSHNTGGYVGGSAYYLGPYASAGGSDSSGYYQNWD
jgi:hypothetical protein